MEAWQRPGTHAGAADPRAGERHAGKGGRQWCLARCDHRRQDGNAWHAPRHYVRRPENLSAVGGGLYTETLGSGRPQIGSAAQSRIFSGYQLGSTVDLAAEMTNMVADQQEYAINAKALQTIDSLVSTVVNLSAR